MERRAVSRQKFNVLFSIFVQFSHGTILTLHGTFGGFAVVCFSTNRCYNIILPDSVAASLLHIVKG